MAEQYKLKFTSAVKALQSDHPWNKFQKYLSNGKIPKLLRFMDTLPYRPRKWEEVEAYYKKQYPNIFKDHFFWFEVFDYLPEILRAWPSEKRGRQIYRTISAMEYMDIEPFSMRDFYKNKKSKEVVGMNLNTTNDFKYCSSSMGHIGSLCDDDIIAILKKENIIYIESMSDLYMETESFYNIDASKARSGPLNPCEEVSVVLFMFLSLIYNNDELGQSILDVYKNDVNYLEALIPTLKEYLNQFTIERKHIDFSSYQRYTGRREYKLYSEYRWEEANEKDFLDE